MKVWRSFISSVVSLSAPSFTRSYGYRGSHVSHLNVKGRKLRMVYTASDARIISKIYEAMQRWMNLCGRKGGTICGYRTESQSLKLGWYPKCIFRRLAMPAHVFEVFWAIPKPSSEEVPRPNCAIFHIALSIIDMEVDIPDLSTAYM